MEKRKQEKLISFVSCLEDELLLKILQFLQGYLNFAQLVRVEQKEKDHCASLLTKGDHLEWKEIES